MRTMFQRRHYAAIAEIVASAKVQATNSAAQAISTIEDDLAALFKRDNAKFQPGRFFAACERREVLR